LGFGRKFREISVMRIAVVIPAYNEAGNIGRLIEETVASVPADILQEIIVIDDASDDGTGAEIKALIPRHKPLRYLRHAQRAGQSAALRSGVMAATAAVIATMDGDGQNDPGDILRLLAKLGPEGGEPAMVAGIREGRKAAGSRKLASRFANWIRDKVLADGCPDTGCGLKIYRRDAYLALPYFTSMHRYLPAFFQTYGHEIAYEPVNDRPRLRGASKYTNLGRALIGLYDLVGVSWLRKRTSLPPIAEDVSGTQAVAEPRANQVRMESSS
jgi:dolichol-phosphate mannosyltransferase